MGAGGQRDGFEQFVCELAAEDPPGPDARFVSLHGAGGDGGVECFWTLPDGTEVGWQAKFWLTNDDVDKAQLDKSVKTALDVHPKLVEYIIATPVDPTGPTARGGKSLHEKVYEAEGWLSGWQKMAEGLGMQVTFRMEWRTNLITRLKRLDTAGARTRYWFDATVLPDQWWRDRLDEATQEARPRYLPELSVRVPALDALAALCGDPDWRESLDRKVEELGRLVAEVRRDSQGVRPVDLEPVRLLGNRLADALAEWRDKPSAPTRSKLTDALDSARKGVAEAETAESAALTQQYGESWDTVQWRQWQLEYMVASPAAAVDALRKLQVFAAELKTGAVEYFEHLPEAKAALLTGEAGQGKTFVTLDAVTRRLEQGRPSLFLHGKRFRGDSTPLLDQMRGQLELPADLHGQEVLLLLDQAGRAAASPVLLVVDALNESVPRSLWQHELASLVTKISRYEHLRVVFTLRSHYRPEVVPDDLSIPEIVHRGFEGVEHDALKEYADYYELEPPAAPPVQGEFDNPLFLRLLCQALKDEGQLSIGQAALGIDDLVKLLLDATNSRISHQLRAPVADEIVHRAMSVMAKALGTAPRPWLDRARVNALMQDIWPGHNTEASLLEALIAEGLLAEGTDPDAAGYSRNVVAMAFERLGQHLLIVEAISALTTTDEIREELTGGSLRQFLALDSVPDAGLLEALSVVLAHRLGTELTEFRDEIGDGIAVAAVIAGLPWRSESSITEQTQRCLVDALDSKATFGEAMDMLFRLAPRPDHLLNADFLHGLLSPMPMAERDALLVPWLHETRGAGGAVHRLISWARRGDISLAGQATCRLWVTALLWCTGCSDRRVRDDATVGAARLLTRHPGKAPALLAEFLGVDDDWIGERACNAVYTALLRAGSTTDWGAAAEAVWQSVFAGTLPTNAALRDEARSIIQAAADRGTLPPSVDVARALPPYDSVWPVEWPTDDDVQRYEDASADFPKLHFSCTADDFFTYQIETALRGLPGIDPAAAARRILQDAVDLGYEPQLHASFDQYVLDTYGGGRSKPKWIERIGKKYQWIAFARLLGRVSDHVSRPRGRWDPPEPPAPGPQSHRLRQMDPTVYDAQADSPVPLGLHVPTYYWEAVAGAPHEEWIADDSDLPDVAVDISEDVPHVVLAGDYEWAPENRQRGSHPTIWARIVALLVKTGDLDVLLQELDGRNLAGHDVLNFGPTLSGGFVGEYPFGHHYAAEQHLSQHLRQETFSVPTWLASRALLGEYEYSDSPNLYFRAPAPELFGPAPGSLRWDGRSSWLTTDGQVIATARSIFAGGQDELTMDRAWLDDWLSTNVLKIVWLETTDKDVVRDRLAGAPGRLLRTRVRYRGEDGLTAQLEPVFERILPRSESNPLLAADEVTPS